MSIPLLLEVSIIMTIVEDIVENKIVQFTFILRLKCVLSKDYKLAALV